MFGSGEPILFFNGYRSTMDVWDSHLLNNLASKYEVIIFDNRGIGKTSTGNKEFTMDLFTEDTVELLNLLNIEKAHLLGWSTGTNIALNLTINYPNKVDRLVLYAADCGGKEAIFPSDEVIRTLTDTSSTPAEQGKRCLPLLFPDKWLKSHSLDWVSDLFAEAVKSSRTENIEKQTNAMFNWNGVCDKLSEVVQPTLLLTGTDDIVTPPSNSLLIAQRIPKAWLVQIRDGGHGLMYQYPDKLGRIIMTFLET